MAAQPDQPQYRAAMAAQPDQQDQPSQQHQPSQQQQPPQQPPPPHQYLLVQETEHEEAIELPAEEDGSVLLSTVAAQFFGCCGLKYRCPSGGLRGLRLHDERLYPPDRSGWGDTTYICVFPRTPLPPHDSLEAPSSAAASSARRGPSPRCSDLIVLGLPWKTTEDAIREYFRPFGDLPLVQIKRDPKTGSSKGFGFIKFADYEAQLKALGQRHLIDGRWCDVRIPNSKEGLAAKVTSKVFVGRCTENVTADDLRDYFSKFGKVTDVFVPRPFRAFGFVTFLDPEVAQGLCGEDHIIKGVSVNVSNASPKRDRDRRSAPTARREDPQRRGRAYQDGAPQAAGPGGYRWTGRGPEQGGARGGGGPAQGPHSQSANVNLPMNIPMNQALVAALNPASWGLPVEGYQPPQQPTVSHQRSFLNWVPPNGGGGEGGANHWPVQQDVSAKNYVKYD